MRQLRLGRGDEVGHNVEHIVAEVLCHARLHVCWNVTPRVVEVAASCQPEDGAFRSRCASPAADDGHVEHLDVAVLLEHARVSVAEDDARSEDIASQWSSRVSLAQHGAARRTHLASTVPNGRRACA
jgi:hypothetical protein